ncbi:hypothetical protein [Streptomyces sp. NPDC093094]|uniref:hypothetical protein n=1 Tax=Streptomyces sp. NPDC093094 TaxID=3366026 RepID=UPI00380B49EB
MERGADPDADDLTAFLARLTGLLLRSSGEGARLAARRPHGPPRLVLILPGFFTLTVGSLGMRGLTGLAGGYVVEGFRDLLELVTVVTAIAVGLVVGGVLVPGSRAPVPAEDPAAR